MPPCRSASSRRPSPISLRAASRRHSNSCSHRSDNCLHRSLHCSLRVAGNHSSSHRASCHHSSRLYHPAPYSTARSDSRRPLPAALPVFRHRPVTTSLTADGLRNSSPPSTAGCLPPVAATTGSTDQLLELTLLETHAANAISSTVDKADQGTSHSVGYPGADISPRIGSNDSPSHRCCLLTYHR